MRAWIAILCAGILGLGIATAQNPEILDPARLAQASRSTTGENWYCSSCAAEASPGQFYAEVEYLMRWFKPVCASVPVVTVGNPQDTVPGAVGQPGTQIVVGGEPPHKFEFPATSGVQLTAGWVRADGLIGVEFSGFLMAQAGNSQVFNAAADGSPFTYLPYLAPDNSAQALPFTIPGVVTGNSVALGTTKIWGAEGDLTFPFTLDRPGFTVYGRLLLGGRYLDLTDQVRITNALQLVSDPSVRAIGAERFRTRNQFGGPQVGTTLGIATGGFSFEFFTKVAGGLTSQFREIEGGPLTSTTAPDAQLLPGPLQAQPSNVGREAAARVTLVPEIGVKTRLALTPQCSLTLGYSLLYWNKVLCPGDQMSPLVNITQLPGRGPATGPLDPKPLFNHTDYFAQGFDVGFQFQF